MVRGRPGVPHGPAGGQRQPDPGGAQPRRVAHGAGMARAREEAAALAGALLAAALLGLPVRAGDRGDAPVKPLVPRLGDPDPAVREQAAVEVGRLGPDGAEAIPALAAALRYSGENDVPSRAAWALGEIGPASVPALIAA